MLNFHQSLPFLNWLFPLQPVHRIFLQDFPTRISRKIFLSWILIGWLPITLFQMLNFHQSLPFLNWLFPLLPAPQDFPTRFSCKIFLSWILIGWLSITLFQMLNFHQSLPFLNWLFPLLLVPQEFPTRISCKICHRISRKISLQDFPARISLLIIKVPKCPHHPFPKLYGNPESMNTLTLSEPAISFNDQN